MVCFITQFSQLDTHFPLQRPLRDRTKYKTNPNKAQNTQKCTRFIEEEKANEEYIKKLQEEDIKKEQKEKIDCPICLDDLVPQFAFFLENCPHFFHIECLETYIIDQIKNRKFPIRCPDPECKAEIPENDVKDSLQTHVEYQRIYNEYSIKTYIEANPNEYYHCPTADCAFVCLLSDQLKFDCPLCRKSYCTNCKTVWHSNLGCEQFQQLKSDQSDDVFIRHADDMGYVPCPRCKIRIERTHGCNQMNCLICHTEFCYLCGKEGNAHNEHHCLR